MPTDKPSIERWAEPFGYRTRPLENMSGLLKEYRDKIANAMQMMKAMEIREKKRRRGRDGGRPARRRRVRKRRARLLRRRDQEP